MTAERAVLLVGDRADQHVQAVLGALGKPALVFDASSLGRMSYVFRRDEFIVNDGNDEWLLSSRVDTRGWLRRLAPTDWHRGHQLGSRQAAVQSAWLSLLAGIARTCRAEWLTEIDQLVITENKTVQAVAAHELQIDTPKFIVTSSPLAVRQMFGGDIVVKPLGVGDYVEDSKGRAVFATRMSADDGRLGALGGAPFLVQEYIAAKRHYRVATVRGKAWAAYLDAAPYDVDWRQDPCAHRSFVAGAAPQAILAGALAIAQRLLLGYSCQDWILARDGRAVLLDVNPAGQWLFLPQEVSDQITCSIARWLSRGESN